MSHILRQLSAAAAKAGIELDGDHAGRCVPVAGAEALPMTMIVKGRYFAIQQFLPKLRSEADVKVASWPARAGCTRSTASSSRARRRRQPGQSAQPDGSSWPRWR